MIVAELVTCRVPKDPAYPILGGGIPCGVHGILRAGIWCAITLISPLNVVVLWLGTAALDPLGDLADGVTS
jgi:hypothetical protein